MSAEEEIVKNNFDSGVIDPFTHWGAGDASYVVLPPEQDPLYPDSQDSVCKLIHPSTGGRSSLLFVAPSDSSHNKIRMLTTWMTQVAADTDWVGVLVAGNQGNWAKGKQAEFTIYHSQWRLDYWDRGGYVRAYFGSVLPNRKYNVELTVIAGSGNGEVHVKIDGVELFTKIGLINVDVGSVMNRFEVGAHVGVGGASSFIYNAEIYGTVIPKTTVTFQVVDENGIAIPNVGVKVGSDPIVKPWLAGYYIAGRTDTNGRFSFSHDKIIVPEIKLIKLGYGNPIYPVGSVTILTNIDLVGAGDNVDLGVIQLTPRIPIQAQPLLQGKYWTFRSITVWPYAKQWGTQAFADQLQLIKDKDLRWNMIDLRWGVGTDPSGIYDIVGAIDQAHTAGFKVLLTLAFQDKGTKDEIKALILNRLERAYVHNVEALVLGWEIWTKDDGHANNDWQEILSEVRAYIASTPDWKPLIGYAATCPAGDNAGTRKLFDNAWFRGLDFLIVLNNRRTAPSVEGNSAYDPTESDIEFGWSIGHGWWEGVPVDMPRFYAELSDWLGKPVVPNLWGGVVDGINKQWGITPSIRDEEEHALYWKVAFKVFQNVDIGGLAMEHYSFDPSEIGTTGSITGTLAEDFIREGLKAHSVQEPSPPSKSLLKASIASAIFASIILGLASLGKGGVKERG